MPVLNWIGKDKVINHDKELPFRVLKPVKNLSVGKDSENLLIEGDNLEALKSLMPFYYNKVKCIYIDPPYNTGNEKWVYNDKVNSPQIKAWLNKVVGAEGEDLCRHDKWLCMMYPRLKLLHDLLSEDGVIFISIDENEVYHLRNIMDEIFGVSNFVESLIWKSRLGKGATSQLTAKLHEYVIVYSKNINQINFKTDKRFSNKDSKERLRQWGQGDRKEDRPTMYYPILSKEFGEIYPTKPDGTDGRWRVSKKTMEEFIDLGIVTFEKQSDGRIEAYKAIPSGSETNTAYSSILDSEIVKTTAHGSVELKRIFGEPIFAYPKPSTLIKELISLCSEGEKDFIILDSFAGSGTTGQAVLELNKEDGGNRKFVLVELEREISKNITAKRIKKVVEGYEGAKFPEGTGGGFEYLDLNGMLYDYSGYVNPDAKYEDMAAYVYFTETQTYLDLAKIKNPHIGSLGSTHYFLFFKGQGDNILDEETLKKTDGVKGSKVIYADKCLIDDEALAKKGITFKQIPYELKKY